MNDEKHVRKRVILIAHYCPSVLAIVLPKYIRTYHVFFHDIGYPESFARCRLGLVSEKMAPDAC